MQNSLNAIRQISCGSVYSVHIQYTSALNTFFDELTACSDVLCGYKNSEAASDIIKGKKSHAQ